MHTITKTAFNYSNVLQCVPGEMYKWRLTAKKVNVHKQLIKKNKCCFYC